MSGPTANYVPSAITDIVGLAAALSAGDSSLYRRGDGSWAMLNVAAIPGLASALSASDSSLYRRGDGSWAPLDADAIAGLAGFVQSSVPAIPQALGTTDVPNFFGLTLDSDIVSPTGTFGTITADYIIADGSLLVNLPILTPELSGTAVGDIDMGGYFLTNAGGITTTGTLTAPELQLFNNLSGYSTYLTSGFLLEGSRTLVLPTTAASYGDVLSNDGTDSLFWAPIPTGGGASYLIGTGEGYFDASNLNLTNVQNVSVNGGGTISTSNLSSPYLNDVVTLKGTSGVGLHLDIGDNTHSLVIDNGSYVDFSGMALLGIVLAVEPSTSFMSPSEQGYGNGVAFLSTPDAWISLNGMKVPAYS